MLSDLPQVLFNEPFYDLFYMWEYDGVTVHRSGKLPPHLVTTPSPHWSSLCLLTWSLSAGSPPQTGNWSSFISAESGNDSTDMNQRNESESEPSSGGFLRMFKSHSAPMRNMKSEMFS